MNVFISWSGELSHAVALAFKNWLKCVLQGVKPWMSSTDIEKGALWGDQLNSGLSGAAVGVVFLTNENLLKPWILFEAGALAKGLSANRVCTVLVDVDQGQLSAPLAQFQSTRPDVDGFRSLCEMLNASLQPAGRELDPETLETVFKSNWPRLEANIRDAMERFPTGKKVERTKEDVTSELLGSLRSVSNRLSRIEKSLGNRSNFPPLLRSAGDYSMPVETPTRWAKLKDISPALHALLTEFGENSEYDRILEKKAERSASPDAGDIDE